uniref:60S acidic ribosomal protein P2 n=1 Tax=Anthurium amnicola TaxID=1678845 RepID=A0A1D1ZK13_9ARAE
MKHLAAYLLLSLAGKTPNESSIKSLLETVGIEADNDRLKQLLSELKGKDIDELVSSGLSKLSSVPTGGGAAASSGAAASNNAAAEAAPAEEAKKEEEKEESDEDMGFGLFD